VYTGCGDVHADTKIEINTPATQSKSRVRAHTIKQLRERVACTEDHAQRHQHSGHLRLARDHHLMGSGEE
jgi:hypothetical protein